MDNSFEEDDVEKEVSFLAKNFQKFLKMKNSGKPFNKGKFSFYKGDRKEFRKKDGRSLNLLKESLALSAMDMDMSRKNALII